jgi:UDP-3-O-[3-hydroxymyristoyl] glucosamine N-acyltransferase
VGLTLTELAVAIGAELRGDPERCVERIATLQGADPSAVSFLANRHYRRQLEATRAAAVILSAQDAPLCPTAALVMDNPYLGYARAAGLLASVPAPRSGVHRTAWVSDEARVHESAWVGPQAVVEAGAVVGPRASVGPGCVVAAGAVLGADTRLVAQVSVGPGVRVGERTLVHPGVVLGADGFGLANDGGRWVKIPQLGAVVIGDDVEIGANTTIDRGALEDTVIEDGVKLDNQIQVGHNCRIGAHTAIAGCTGIAGSTRIGRHCMIGGGVGINGHIEICDGAVISGRSVVYQSITEPGSYASGVPLLPQEAWARAFQRFRQLDELARRVKRLEQAAGERPRAIASVSGHEEDE